LRTYEWFYIDVRSAGPGIPPRRMVTVAFEDRKDIG
jgi:hypothetical protein